MVVTAFVVVASLIARALERHVMRLDQLAVSTRVGVSKFANFLLVGLGILLGINAAGVDVTTLNVLTGAIGLGLGFGLQSVASNFVSGFVLLMDKSIKPGRRHQLHRPRRRQHRPTSAGCRNCAAATWWCATATGSTRWCPTRT